jgi:predicted nucleic acid-binding Zn ribbon protein
MKMKRDSNEMPIKEAIERLLKVYKLDTKMVELDAVKCWEEMMGSAIAKRTREIFINKKILYLKLNSAPLKEELKMSKTLIIARLNERMGKEIITDVFFM